MAPRFIDFLRRPPVIASLVMLAFVLILFYIALDYGQKTRMAPLGVCIFAVIILLLSIMSEAFPVLRKRLNVGYFDTMETATKHDKPDDASKDFSKDLALVSSWIVGAFLLALFFGFMIGLSVSLLIYAKYLKKMSWPRSLSFSIAIFVFMYLAFEVGMGLRLFPGILFGGIAT